MAFWFLSIPEGVSVATVISDGVDVAPAGWAGRQSDSRERWSCPADTRIRAPGKRQLGSPLRTEPKLQLQMEGKNRHESVGAVCVNPPDHHDRHFRVGCAHATLRFSHAPETALPFSPPAQPWAKLCPTIIET